MFLELNPRRVSKYFIRKMVYATVFIFSIATLGYGQIACTNYTLTSTTTEIWAGPGLDCPVSVYPTGNTAWTGAQAGGTITHTFPSAQSSVNIMYYHINLDDYGTITTNGGGTVSVSIVTGCMGLVGNTIGPYTGPGFVGPVEINVTSTQPFTTLTLTNDFPTSGFIAGCTPIAPTLGVNLGPDTTMCIGDSFVLDATTPNCTYVWQDNSTLPTYTVTQAGTYWVEITDDQGATASDTVVVDYYTPPTVDLGPDVTLCTGQNVVLDATEPGMTYLWQDNSTLPTHNATTQGWYWVEVSNQCGDVAVDSVYVTVNDQPSVDLGNDLVICIDQTVVLNPSTSFVTDYLWNDNSTDSTLAISLEGTYWVEVSNNCGTSVDSIDILTQLCISNLEMPNVFTPNDDETNDLFVPADIIGIENANIVITNRWGQTVYENNDILSGWNGKHQNTDCEEGTYFWIVNYTTVTGEKLSQHGFVNLIR